MALVFGLENDADNAIISASNGLASLPPSNLKDFDIAKIFRASGSPSTLFVDVGNQVLLGALALINSNGTFADTFRIRTSATDPTLATNLSYDSGPLPGIDPRFGRFVHLPNPINGPPAYRYLSIEMNQVSAPEGGRLFLGDVWRPSRNMSLVFPPEALADDPSRWTYSMSQNLYIDELEPSVGWRFTMRGITDDEKTSFVDELNRLRGRRKDLFICINDASSNLGRDSVWGMLRQQISAQRMQELPEFWQCGVEIWGRI